MKSGREYRLRAFLARALLLALALSSAPNCLAAPAKAPLRPAALRADANTRALLSWLASLPSRASSRLMAGQELGTDSRQGYWTGVDGLERRSIKAPALIGIDFAQHGDAALAEDLRVITEHWRKGGLATVHAHFGNPWTGGGYRDFTTGDGSYADAYTPGTPAYGRLKREFDRLADAFLLLGRAGIPILFRPFHEANGQWFWWHSDDPDKFKKLWKCWFDYLTVDRGVANLLFVFSPNAPWPSMPEAFQPWKYYPGGDCVDLNALDFYADDPATLSTLAYSRMLALGKPLALGEVGPDFGGGPATAKWDPGRLVKAIKAKFPAIVYWLSWSSWDPDVTMALSEYPGTGQALSDPWILGRGELDFAKTEAPETPASLLPPPRNPGALDVGFIDGSSGETDRFPDGFSSDIEEFAQAEGSAVAVHAVRGVGPRYLGLAVERLATTEACRLIIVDNWFSDGLAAAIAKYPSIAFASTAAIPGAPGNYCSYGIDPGPQNFMEGAIAAAATKTGRVGFVAAARAPWQFVQANLFAAGAKAVDPGVKVFVAFHGKSVGEAANRLIAAGCDVLSDRAQDGESLALLDLFADEAAPVRCLALDLPRESRPEVIIDGAFRDRAPIYRELAALVRKGSKLPPNLYWGPVQGCLRFRMGSGQLMPSVEALLAARKMPSPPGGGATVADFLAATASRLSAAAAGPVPDDRFLDNAAELPQPSATPLPRLPALLSGAWTIVPSTLPPGWNNSRIEFSADGQMSFFVKQGSVSVLQTEATILSAGDHFISGRITRSLDASQVGQELSCYYRLRGARDLEVGWLSQGKVLWYLKARK
jgi:mannan endo-1,4-beta-mannosidase